MNKNNLHILLQYILLCARQNEEKWDWDLGPIHFIKYVYLADLDYAKKHSGQTFTGIDWVFYNFGPWSTVVHEEIPVALLEIGAHLETLPSDYSGDYQRWSFCSDDSDDLYEELGRKIPSSIKFSLSSLVRKYGKVTPDLLDCVYNTKPMLNAAPNDHLDFSTVIEEPYEKEEFVSAMEKLSARKTKKLKERIKELKEAKLQRENQQPERRMVQSKMPPVDDGVLEAGLKWLDSLAGAPLPSGYYEVKIDESVWKSSVRQLEEF